MNLMIKGRSSLTFLLSLIPIHHTMADNKLTKGASVTVRGKSFEDAVRISPVNSLDLDEKVDPTNPFADPKVAAHWAEVYENAQYECRHVVDPTLEWTPKEEKALVRRLDFHVCLWACIMFFALQADRGNLAQAVSDNMLPQLGLTTNGMSCFPC